MNKIKVKRSGIITEINPNQRQVIEAKIRKIPDSSMKEVIGKLEPIIGSEQFNYPVILFTLRSGEYDPSRIIGMTVDEINKIRNELR